MEAFSLLKYWRGGGAACLAGDSTTNAGPTSPSTSTTTIITAATPPTSDSDEEQNDDGPFFDLEFAVPDEDDAGEKVNNEENDDSDSEKSDGENDVTDPHVSLSPSDDLFFKGRLVPIEPSETNSKSQFPVSFLKSATKFRVLMLKLKKSKTNLSEKMESNGESSEIPKQKPTQPQGKFFTIKLNVEEVPIVSLFTRDNSSKANKSQNQSSDETTASDEKRFSNDMMQRYLRKVKPLYVRASKRYGEKLGFSGQLSLQGATKAGVSPPPSTTVEKSPQAKSTVAKIVTERVDATVAAAQSNAKSQKQGSLPAGLREVCKHLGKSRSASSAVAAVPSGAISSKRRDDTLLQQQDGIQSAILHCKRSFKASRDSESSILSPSSQEEDKESCI